MRIQVLFTIAFLSLGLVSQAQVSTQVFYQTSAIGIQVGGAFHWEIKNGYAIGAHYQKSTRSVYEAYYEDYTFYGASLQVPLKQCGDLSFKLTPKIGFVNKFFLILIPEVTTELAISRRLSTLVSTGIRARQPSLSLGLKLRMI